METLKCRDGIRRYVNGELNDHGNDKPAFESIENDKHWYTNGLRHRNGGLPAIKYHDGGEEYWIDGHYINYLPLG